jgi:hypothetical protein
MFTSSCCNGLFLKLLHVSKEFPPCILLLT